MLAAHRTAQPTYEIDANQDIVVVGSCCCYMARRPERTDVMLCWDVNIHSVPSSRRANCGSDVECSGM